MIVYFKSEREKRKSSFTRSIKIRNIVFARGRKATQGSITVPETWNALLRSYGLCERHAWMHIGVEMSFRDEYLLGPTILYAELIEKALCVVSRLESIGRHS